MGEIWERYGRDKNYLSRPETPLYKGISEEDGRDGGYLVFYRFLSVDDVYAFSRLVYLLSFQVVSIVLYSFFFII